VIDFGQRRDLFQARHAGQNLDRPTVDPQPILQAFGSSGIGHRGEQGLVN